MEDLDAEEENGANRLPTGNVPFNHITLLYLTDCCLCLGGTERDTSFLDVQGDLHPDNWDCAWLDSLVDDGAMSGDLVFGFFA